jgi:hypothetical protein
VELFGRLVRPGKASVLERAHPNGNRNDCANAEKLGKDKNAIEKFCALTIIEEGWRLDDGHPLKGIAGN